MVVGITGKSCSGKSTVANYIASLGYKVIDVDIIHKEVSAACMGEIYAIFEKHGYGALTHKEKVALFFKNKKIRNEVNALTYTETRNSIINECLESKGHILILDAPLLFEMGMDTLCNKIWYIYCPHDVNIRRLMKRNNLTCIEAEERYNAIDFGNYYSKFNLQLDTQRGNKRKINAKLKEYKGLLNGET